jgi:hypothetical protein
MYTYRQIFKQSIITLRHSPSLWFFGFFTALLGNAGGLELVFSSYGFGSEGIIFAILSGFISGGLFTKAAMEGLAKAIFTHPVYVFLSILFLLVIFAISLLLLWISIVSQTALIAKVISIAKSKKLEFKDAFRLGISKFWPVFGINVLIRLVSLVLFISIGALSLLRFPGAVFVFIIGFTLLLILILVVSFIGKFAIFGVVLENWKFRNSIKQAFNIFAKNWWLSLEMEMILFLIYAVTNLILIYLISWVLFLAFKAYALFFFALVLTFFLAFAVFLSVQVILSVFIWGSWAIVFEILVSKKFALTSFLHKIFKQ